MKILKTTKPNSKRRTLRAIHHAERFIGKMIARKGEQS